MTTTELLAKFRAGEKPPAAALRLVEGQATATEGNADGDKSIKVHLKARTRNDINHWFWGKIVHDFSTLKMPTKIALDDTHGDEIGYARPMLTDYGLELDGVVIPNAENPQHESNRIAYNLRNSIPQQASIDWAGDYDLEEIPEKFSAPVNGLTVEGPALIVRNWSLRATAICKEGADPTTETTVTTFAATDATAGAGPRNIVSGRTPPAAVETAAATAAVVEAAAAVPPENPATPPPAEDATPATVETAAAETAPENTLDATVAQLTAENADLKTRLAASEANEQAAGTEIVELKTRLEKLSGGTKPIPAGQTGNGKTLWQQYREIPGQDQKTLFYRAHKAIMDKNPNA
jgi:hypothetical protein